jgi:hypothetical protein
MDLIYSYLNFSNNLYLLFYLFLKKLWILGNTNFCCFAGYDQHFYSLHCYSLMCSEYIFMERAHELL